MKITRAIATILLSIILFPTIFLGIQGLILKNTLYGSNYMTDLINDYELNTIADTSLVIDLEQSLSNTINDDQDSTIYDSILLTKATDLTRQSLKGTIDGLYLGMYHYFFTKESQLPVIAIGYLEPTFNTFVNGLNTRYNKTYSPTILSQFPQQLDLNAYLQKASISDASYFLGFKSITFNIPKRLSLAIITTLILGIIAYTVIHRYDWVKSFSFLALIGTLASLLTLILLASTYWLLPQNNTLLNSASFPFFGLRDDHAFLTYASNTLLAESLRICLILLIIFVVCLIASEFKHRLYPKKEWVESHKEAQLQVIIFMVTMGLLILSNLVILKSIPTYYDNYGSSTMPSISENGQEVFTFIDLLLSSY